MNAGMGQRPVQAFIQQTYKPGPVPSGVQAPVVSCCQAVISAAFAKVTALAARRTEGKVALAQMTVWTEKIREFRLQTSRPIWYKEILQ
jgi:hypothetical protein